MPRELYKKKPTSTKTNTKSVKETEEDPQQDEMAALSTLVAEEEFERTSLTKEESNTPLEPLAALSSTVAPRPLALSDLPLDVIVPNPFQARKTFDSDRLQDLANAMKEHGIISRIRVRKVSGTVDDDERYELVYGERRWRAARLAGISHYPVEIAQYSDDEMVEIGLLENVQREDLTPLDEAQMYQRLLEQADKQGQPRYSIRKLAERIGKDKSYIEMRLAVLRAPEDVQRLVEELPETPLRAAFEIGKVADPQARESILADVREGKLQKVEEIKARVREITGKPPKEKVVIQPVPVAPAPVASEQSVVPIIEQPINEQTEASKVSVEVSNASVDSAQALVLFEQRLQKVHIEITDILQRLAAETEAMAPAQREVLILYVDRWGKALMDLKSHAHIRNE